MKKQTKKGFTLVELVIVIAVIAVLSAILIPTFGNVIADAKEKAELEDVRTTYTQVIANHKEDPAVTTKGAKAYILVGATVSSADSKISGAKSAYSFEKGVEKVDFADNLKVDVVSTDLTDETKIEVNKAYKINDTMYIVFIGA